MFLEFLAMAPAGNGAQQNSGLMMWMPLILIFLIMYLLILRPASKRQKEMGKMLQSIQKGDHIVTTGGIHGTVVRAGEGEQVIMIKIADNVKIEIDRGAVARRVGTGEVA